jgi:hypothetical protein
MRKRKLQERITYIAAPAHDRNWPKAADLRVTQTGSASTTEYFGRTAPVIGTAVGDPLRTFNRQSYIAAMAINFGPDWQRELWASLYRLRFKLKPGPSSARAPHRFWAAQFQKIS